MRALPRTRGGWWRAIGLSLGLAPGLAWASPPDSSADPPDDDAAADATEGDDDALADDRGDDAPADDGGDDAPADDEPGPDSTPIRDAIIGDTLGDDPVGPELDDDELLLDSPADMDPVIDGDATVVNAGVPPPSVEDGDDEIEAEAHETVKLRNPKIPPTGNTQMWFRSTSFFEYFGNNYNSLAIDEPTPNTNDDRFFAIVNYVNFGSDTRLKNNWQISTMIRADTHNVFNAKPQALCDLNGDGAVSDTEFNSCNFGSDYRLERFQLRFGNKYFTVTAGDFNVNFGRGVGLSIRKIADIGVDATIKGGRVDIKTKPIELTAIAGVTNRQQTDFATRQLFKDPGYPHLLCEQTPGLTRNKYGFPLWTMCSDIIAGGRVDAKLPGKVRLGGHYNFFWFGQPVQSIQHDGMHSVGGDIQRKRIAKHWDLFAGATVLLRNEHHRKNYPDLPETGVAAYLSNSLTFGQTFVLVEGKYYDNYVVAKDVSATTVQYAEPPTLERADQIIPAASNTAGGRLLVEQTLGKTRLTLIGNYLGYAFSLINDEDMFRAPDAEMAHHGYVGLRWRDLERGIGLQAYVGYRWEGYQRLGDHELRHTRKLPHAEVYYNHQVAKSKNGLSHSLSFRGEWRWEDVKKTESQRRRYFHRGNLILGYALSPFLQLSLIGGFSSEFPGLTSEPQLHPQPCEDEDSCQRKPHLWPGVELRVNFLESSFVRIFAGRQVGGLLCVNGSCRNLPDFEGVRMDVILSF